MGGGVWYVVCVGCVCRGKENKGIEEGDEADVCMSSFSELSRLRKGASADIQHQMQAHHKP